jgi:hypothetical protein
LSVSIGFSPLTIAAALGAAESFIGPYQLLGTTPDQHALVAGLRPYADALPSYKYYTAGFAAETAAEINRELAARGFDIRLADWPASPIRRSFGVAGVTGVTVNWYRPGKVVTIESDGQQFPGFAAGNAQRAELVQIDGFDQPMVLIETMEGLELRLVMTGAPSSQLDLMDEARRLYQARVNPARSVSCSAAHLPMVRLKQQPDIDWLVGLGLTNGAGVWEIGQAKQEVRFGMNQYGARAKEATAFGVRALSAEWPSPYVVDQPFLIVIGRPGQVEAPLFGAYVTQDDWADPGDLSTL